MRRQAGPALPHLRAGRHARDAARLPGAPPAGERRQHLVRQPHRRRQRAGRRAGRRPGATVAAMAAREGAVGVPHPAIALPRELYGADARQLARARPGERDASWPRSPQALRRQRAQRLARRRRCSAVEQLRERRRALPVRNPADQRDVVGQVREADAADVEAALRRGRWPRRRLGATPRRPSAPPRWSAPPTLLEADIAALLGPDRARSRQDRCQRDRRSARGGRLPALLRARRCGATSTTTRTARSGPVRLHQPVELSAGDLHRPGRRGAGRRQPRAGQAGRADAADRRRGGAHAASRPACRATRCSCCPGAARRRRARWSADARVQGVMFTGSTEVARLIAAPAGRSA